jgi:hypothetical protein
MTLEGHENAEVRVFRRDVEVYLLLVMNLFLFLYVIFIKHTWYYSLYKYVTITTFEI